MTTRGSDQLSYCAASTRYTRKDGEREDVDHGVAGKDFLVGQFGPLELHAVGQLVSEELGHGGFGLAGTVAGRGSAINFGSGKTVVVHDAIRAVDGIDGNNGTERNHFTGRISGFEANDIFCVESIWRFGLHVDLIGTAEAIEVVNVERAEIDLHGFENIFERDAIGFGFVAIDVSIDLRDVDVETGKEASELGSVIPGLQGGGGFVVESFEAETAAIFDVELEAADGAETLNRRRREDGDEGFLDGAELLIQVGGDGVGGEFGRFALVEGLERGEDNTGIGAIGETVDGETGKGDGVLDTGVFHGDVGHFANDIVGAIESGAVGELRESDEIAFILRGNEARRNASEATDGESDETGVDEQSDEAGAHGVTDEFAVAVGRSVEKAIEDFEEPAEGEINAAGEDVFLGLARLEEESGESGAESERVERGDDGGDGDGEGKLFVELAGETDDEGGGNEDGGEDESDSDDGAADFGHSTLGGDVRLVAEFDVALDVFDYDDGVVYDDTYGENETEEREGVQREAERQHDGKRADERNGESEKRNDGSAPGLEENEDDKNNEDERFNEGVADSANGFANEDGGIVGDGVVDTLGEGFFEALHGLANLERGFEGVGAGTLGDGKSGGRFVVEKAAQGVRAGAEFDATDIADTGDLAVFGSANDDVGEFVFGGETALGVDEELKGGAVIARGRSTEYSGSDLNILLANGIDDIGGGEIVRGELIGVEPHTHAEIAGAEDLYVANTGKAVEFVLHLENGEVGEIESVVTTIGRNEVNDHEEVGRSFFGGYAETLNFLRKAWERLRDAILDLDLSFVEVGAQAERDR